MRNGWSTGGSSATDAALDRIAEGLRPAARVIVAREPMELVLAPIDP